MNRRSVRRTASLVALGLLVLGSGGCKSKGTVSGKVAHKGKPVIWGTVTIIGSDKIQYAGQITPEGTYTVPDVPGGPVKIAVSSPNPDGTSRGGPAAQRGGDLAGAEPPPPVIKSGGWFPIPDKYSNPETSGLTGTVNADTVINLDLP
jgi:hypothetical protein